MPHYDAADTICALASPTGSGARGIIRISGREVVAILSRVLCTPGAHLADIRAATAIEGTIAVALAEREVELPLTLLLWPTAHSYTREPSAELHLIGSPPLLLAVLQTLQAQGARPAKPGEFTLRAFLAGRIDLTQAEAVLGVIDARTEAQFDTALEQLAGGLARPLTALREALLDLLAQLEAGLDFAEEDLEFITRDEVLRQLTAAESQLLELQQQLVARQNSAAHPRVVLVGKPNVGKSSLFRALAETEALVSDQAGTTRDYLVATCHWQGLAFDLVDTAGLDPAGGRDEVSQAAETKARRQLDQADLRLWCLRVTEPTADETWGHLDQADPERNLLVWTRADEAASKPKSGVPTSAFTGQGLSLLRDEIVRRLAAQQASSADAVGGTVIRCQGSLQGALAALERGKALASRPRGEELLAAEVQDALRHLGEMVGQVYTDDLLDRIFSRFCIGK